MLATQHCIETHSSMLGSVEPPTLLATQHHLAIQAARRGSVEPPTLLATQHCLVLILNNQNARFGKAVRRLALDCWIRCVCVLLLLFLLLFCPDWLVVVTMAHGAAQSGLATPKKN